MKLSYAYLFLAVLAVSCQPAAEQPEVTAEPANDGKALFEQNSATVRALLEAFQNENVDHAAFYSDSVIMADTPFGSNDTIDLDAIKQNHEMMFAMYDFALDMDSLNLLPGVNAETKEIDGSVRYYGDWSVTITATDSTDEKSGILPFYESFDFNEDGKIIYQQYYADITGLMTYLHDNRKED